MVTSSGDPGSHLGFVREEEEEEMAVGEDCFDSDSDDDVGRYVFLARQPALVDSQALAEDDESSGDDDDAMPGGEAGGSRGGKRLLLREIFDASPSRKKARVDLTPLLAPASSQCGARGKKSGSHVRVPEQEGEAKNKKCGKRKWSPGREAGEGSHRVVAAAKTAAVDPGASRRFVCNTCGRCFVSHQALGGHVLGHMKKAKNAITLAASHHEEVTGGNGYCNAKMAAVAVSQEVANGNGNNNENTAIAASHDHTDGNGHDEEKAITLPSYGYYGSGNSNSDEEMAIVAANQNGHNAGRNAKEKKVLAAASHNGADGNRDAKEKKVAAGRCHKGASNGNSSVRKTQHKCEVCGKECLSGQALGGHMRKHRERPAHDGGGGGGEGRSARPASAGDSEPPCLQRAAVITGGQPAQ